MNHWRADFGQTLVLGHRGACAHYPENTLGSMQLAHTQGANGTEFDVKMSKDGHVLLMHDTDVNRTTHSQGNVHDLTLAQLRALNAGLGERVPTLDEVFECFAGATAETTPFLLNVEVTNYATQGDGLEHAIAQVLARHPKISDQVMFSSFSMQTLHRLLQHAPHIPRGFLHHPKFHSELQGLDTSALQLSFEHPHFSTVSPENTAKLAQSGIRINTWTVNEPDDMRKMFAAKVAGIMGDSPVLMRKIRAEAQL